MRRSYPFPQTNGTGLFVNSNSIGGKIVSTNLRKAFLIIFRLAHCTVLPNHFLIMQKAKTHIETSQCYAPNYLINMPELSFIGAQKLAPRGGIEEQVLHIHRGALRVACRSQLSLHVSPFNPSLPRLLIVGRFRS